jgi:hypothetical protein
MVKGGPPACAAPPSRRSADRGSGEARRRLDAEVVGAWPDQREAVEAGREIVDRAAAVGDGAAGHHAARIGGCAVVAEDLRRLAGGIVDQGDPGAAQHPAVEAVEDVAERIGEHVQSRGRGRGAVIGAEALDGEKVAGLDAEPAIAAGRRRRDLHRLEEAGEPARIGAGLEHGQRLAVAAAGADDHVDGFDERGIEVAGMILDHEQKGRPEGSRRWPAARRDRAPGPARRWRAKRVRRPRRIAGR